VTLGRHKLETFDICVMQSAEPVQVAATCRCGEWHLQLKNDAGVDIDEQIDFAFKAHAEPHRESDA
jgi:hypothetical protein